MKEARKQFPAGKRLRFAIECAVLNAFAWLVPKFPRRFVRATGRTLGTLIYWLVPSARRIALQNLDIVFGDTRSLADKRRITRESLRNAGATLLTLFWSSRLTRENISPLIDVDTASLERVRALNATGKPIIFVTMHTGDWELIGIATAWHGFNNIAVVQEAMPNEALEAIFGRLRGVSGNRLVPNKSAAMGLLKTLKRGGCIAMLIDMNAGKKRGGDWLDFFGLPVFNHAAIGALARHTGAAIVGGIAYPLPDGRMRLEYTLDITSETTDEHTINQDCLRFCEGVIRRAPEAWLWSYKRWKNRPSREIGRYPAYSRYLEVWENKD
ncbi:MAG: hypothetical protein WCS70_14475 [Verrucomicrobiota bacterium]